MRMRKYKEYVCWWGLDGFVHLHIATRYFQLCIGRSSITIMLADHWRMGWELSINDRLTTWHVSFGCGAIALWL